MDQFKTELLGGDEGRLEDCKAIIERSVSADEFELSGFNYDFFSPISGEILEIIENVINRVNSMETFSEMKNFDFFQKLHGSLIIKDSQNGKLLKMPKEMLNHLIFANVFADQILQRKIVNYDLSAEQITKISNIFSNLDVLINRSENFLAVSHFLSKLSQADRNLFLDIASQLFSPNNLDGYPVRVLANLTSVLSLYKNWAKSTYLRSESKILPKGKKSTKEPNSSLSFNDKRFKQFLKERKTDWKEKGDSNRVLEEKVGDILSSMPYIVPFEYKDPESGFIIIYDQIHEQLRQKVFLLFSDADFYREYETICGNQDVLKKFKDILIFSLPDKQTGEEKSPELCFFNENFQREVMTREGLRFDLIASASHMEGVNELIKEKLLSALYDVVSREDAGLKNPFDEKLRSSSQNPNRIVLNHPKSVPQLKVQPQPESIQAETRQSCEDVLKRTSHFAVLPKNKNPSPQAKANVCSAYGENFDITYPETMYQIFLKNYSIGRLLQHAVKRELITETEAYTIIDNLIKSRETEGNFEIALQSTTEEWARKLSEIVKITFSRGYDFEERVVIQRKNLK